MPSLWTVEDVPGATELISWFGCWPSFHDAQFLVLHVLRIGESWLKIHTWQMTNSTDDSGNFVRDKHVVVTFRIFGIQQLKVRDINPHNAIAELKLNEVHGGIEIENNRLRWHIEHNFCKQGNHFP